MEERNKEDREHAPERMHRHEHEKNRTKNQRGIPM